jgi:DNA-binding response OmpR family regulator
MRKIKMATKILLVQTSDAGSPVLLNGGVAFEVRIISELSSVMKSVRDFGPALILVNVKSLSTDLEELFSQLATLKSTRAIKKVVSSRRLSSTDGVKALEMGADDFFLSTISERELIARLNAVLRSYQADLTDVTTFRNLTLNRKTMEVTIGQRVEKLSRVECQLLAYLMQKPGCVTSREELLDNLWLPLGEVRERRIVDVYVYRLRSKIEEDIANPRLLLTRKGAGYSLADPHELAI